MSFDRLETAVRVREIINKSAKRQIDIQVPKPLIGRVISVDLPRKQATVWFPGDDQPVPVKLFSSTVPSAWQSQFASANTSYNSYTGYGSNVVVQTFNGQKYITDVLSGGQFAFDLNAMNMSIVTTEANVTNSFGIYGRPYETFANMRVNLGTLNVGEATLIGPFTRGDFDAAGWFEISWQTGDTTKQWKFNVATYQDFAGDAASAFDRWYRVVPCSEITNNSSNQTLDADLDVALRQTPYGIDNQYQSQYDEFWIRLVRASADVSGLVGEITIRTTLAQKFRALDGSELLIQAVDTNPSPILGYVGYHNSQGPAKDYSNSLYKDSVNRTSTSSWGTSNEVIPIQYNLNGGLASNYSTTPGWARITAAAVSTTYTATINKQSPVTSDLGGKDCDVFFLLKAPNALPTGGSIFAGCNLGYVSASTYVYVRFEFTTGGAINLAVFNRTASADGAAIASNNSTGLTFTAGQIFRVHARVSQSDALNASGTSYISVEAVASGSSFIRNWLIYTPLASFNASGRGVGFRMDRAAANSNTNPFCEFGDIQVYMEYAPKTSSERMHTGPWRPGELRAADLLQRTWTCDGHFVWSSGRLRWYEEIVFSGIGYSRVGLMHGIAHLKCPEYQTIPVYSGNGVTSVAANTTGIPLNQMESLWVGIPPGSPNRNLQTELFIVSHFDVGPSAFVPEWAVLIAYRDQNDVIRLGNGESLTANADIRMVASYEAVASAQVSPVPVSATDITGASITFSVSRPNARAEVQGYFDAENLSASTAVLVCTLNADGAEQTAQALHTAAALGGRATVTQAWTVSNLTAGVNHTFKLQARSPSSSTAHRVNAAHTKIRIQVYE